jgi:hypothetical protein
VVCVSARARTAIVAIDAAATTVRIVALVVTRTKAYHHHRCERRASTICERIENEATVLLERFQDDARAGRAVHRHAVTARLSTSIAF